MVSVTEVLQNCYLATSYRDHRGPYRDFRKNIDPKPIFKTSVQIRVRRVIPFVILVLQKKSINRLNRKRKIRVVRIRKPTMRKVPTHSIFGDTSALSYREDDRSAAVWESWRFHCVTYVLFIEYVTPPVCTEISGRCRFLLGSGELARSFRFSALFPYLNMSFYIVVDRV